MLPLCAKGPGCVYNPGGLLTVLMLGGSIMPDSATPRTAACQAPLSVGFSRLEYWSGLPFPPPGDLPHNFPQKSEMVQELWKTGSSSRS